MQTLRLLPLALATVPLAAPRLPAPLYGTPLLCQEFAVGEAHSLPWGDDMQGRADYDRTHLVADTARILKTEPDALVRMETLRRAALYAGDDRALAWELVGRAGLAVLEQSSTAAPEALAWLDLGFLTACLEQTGADLGFRPGVAQGQQGYAYLLHALERARTEGCSQTAAIEFAAALVVHPLTRRGPTAEDVQRYDQHLERARAGAAPGSLLERNLAAHAQRFDAGKESWPAPKHGKG